VRIVPSVIVMALVCLGLSGCALFNKRSGNGAGATANTNDALPFRPPEPRAASTTAPTEADLGGLLAGRVLDTFNNRPADAYVRWVCLEDKDNETPVDVAVNAEGYFTIQGLKRGKHYKLIARAKNGDRMLAGVTYTEVPNVRVLIKLSEDFATPATPPVPGAPAYSGQEEGARKAPKKSAEQPAAAIVPGGWQPGGDGLPPTTIGTPRPMIDTNGPPGVPDPTRIATPGAPPSDPLVDLPRSGAPRPQTVEPDGGASPPMGGTPNGPPAPVPSCVLVGKQLVNFALRDLNGDPWEWKRQRRGKLVLLDFWSTTCVPCLHTVPHLRILQEKYGWAGLEVISIACEKGMTHEEKAHKVAGMCSRLQTNYRLLLDGGDACPVRRDFSVQYFPTLVLVDENGWVVWRHEGQLARSELEDVELRIRRRLGVK
jgi:thiol-disulfide isomerase/thioredoxin